METWPILTNMPQEILAMILTQHFKSITLEVIEDKKPINRGAVNDSPANGHSTDGDPGGDSGNEASARDRYYDSDETSSDESSSDDDSSSLDTPDTPCKIDYSGHELAILRTCKKLYEASQSVLTAEFLAQNVLFCHSGCIIPPGRNIQVGPSIVQAKNLERISGNEQFANKLHKVWDTSSTSYPKVRELMVGFWTRVDIEFSMWRRRPLSTQFSSLSFLRAIGKKRGIGLRIFLSITLEQIILRVTPNIKLVVQGNNAVVWAMDWIFSHDIPSIRTMIKSTLDCEMTVPAVLDGENKYVSRYWDRTVEWQNC